jgi:uncharacterized protein
VPAGPITPADETEEIPRWGLGDVGLGFLLAELAAALVGVVVVSALGYTRPAQVPLWLETVLEIPLWVFLVGVPLVASRRKGNGPVRDFGWRMRWVDVPVGIAAGLAGQLLLVPLVYWPIFKILGHSENVSKVAEQMTNKVHGPADTVLIFLLVGIGAPLAEELFFRGLTQRSLLKLRDDNPNALLRFMARTNPWSAVVVTAAFFAATHFQLLQFAGLFAFGLVLGALAWRTGRLGPSIWAHLTFNVLAAATLVWKL